MVLWFPCRCRLYKVHFQFLPYDIYKEDLYVNPTKILSLVEKKFFTSLVAAINKKYRDIAQSTLVFAAQSLHSQLSICPGSV